MMMMMYALFIGLIAAALAVMAFALHITRKVSPQRGTDQPRSDQPGVSVSVGALNLEAALNGQSVAIDMNNIAAFSSGLEYLLNRPMQCQICLEYIHPTLFEGHTEVCRIQQQARQQTPSVASSSESSFEEGDECVICLTKQRSVAFVPCGHWSCCKRCASKITTCPMCREQVREHLYVSGKAVNKCAVCKLQIHPTFYTSHREVCRIQMARRAKEESDLQEQQRKIEDADEILLSETSQLDLKSPSSDDVCKPKCAVCNDNPREIAFSPCGHWAACTLCSKTITECPICNMTIRNSIAIFS